VNIPTCLNQCLKKNIDFIYFCIFFLKKKTKKLTWIAFFLFVLSVLIICGARSLLFEQFAPGSAILMPNASTALKFSEP